MKSLLKTIGIYIASTLVGVIALGTMIMVYGRIGVNIFYTIMENFR